MYEVAIYVKNRWIITQQCNQLIYTLECRLKAAHRTHRIWRCAHNFASQFNIYGKYWKWKTNKTWSWRRRPKRDWNIYLVEWMWFIMYQDISKNNNNSNKTKTGIRNVFTPLMKYTIVQLTTDSLTLSNRWNTNLYLSVLSVPRKKAHLFPSHSPDWIYPNGENVLVVSVAYRNQFWIGLQFKYFNTLTTIAHTCINIQTIKYTIQNMRIYNVHTNYDASTTTTYRYKLSSQTALSTHTHRQQTNWETIWKCKIRCVQ